MSALHNMSKLQAALSPNQKLVAVLPPSSLLTTSNNNNNNNNNNNIKSNATRWTLPLYQVSPSSSSLLQATLTWNQPPLRLGSAATPEHNNNSPWKRLVFLNEDHVAGLFQHQLVVVWNVTRGIVLYTNDIQQHGGGSSESKKKKHKKDKERLAEEEDSIVMIDVVTPISTSSSSSSSSSSFQYYYALVEKETKLYVYEYEIESGTLHRKIKCGSVDHSNNHINNNNSHLSLAVVLFTAAAKASSSSTTAAATESSASSPEGRIIVTSGGRQVKVFSLSTGLKVSKMKLASDVIGSLAAVVTAAPQPQQQGTQPTDDASAVTATTTTMTTTTTTTYSGGGAILVAIPTASGVVLGKLHLLTTSSSSGQQEQPPALQQVATLPLKLDNSEASSSSAAGLQMWLNKKTEEYHGDPSMMLLVQQSRLYEYTNINSATTTAAAAAAAMNNSTSALQQQQQQQQPKCQLELHNDSSDGDQYHVLPLTSLSNLPLAVVLYRRGKGIQVKTVNLLFKDKNRTGDTPTSFREKIRLSWNDDHDDGIDKADVVDTTSGNKKRKQALIASTATTLGPGQAGYEQIHVTDRPSKKKLARESQQQQQTQEEEEVMMMGDAEASTVAVDRQADAADATGNAEADLTMAQRLERLAALGSIQDDDDDDDEEEDGKGPRGADKKAVSVNDNDHDGTSRSQTVKFSSKKATTQSLTHLLQQACTSNDNAMLELALSVHDVRIIEQSLRELALRQQALASTTTTTTDGAVNYMEILLTRLITRLVDNPNRAEPLSVWIKCWLKEGRGGHRNYDDLDNDDDDEQEEGGGVHGGVVSSRAIKQQHQRLLQPLRNLLQDRVQSFPLFLQLGGRLSSLKGGRKTKLGR